MSDFSGHSILTVLPMVVRVVSGVLRLPIAKFIDEFGRAHGFLLASGLTILGLFIQALAQSLTETIVAQTLYGIGCNCMDYVLTVIVADMTSLKNRSTLISPPDLWNARSTIVPTPRAFISRANRAREIHFLAATISSFLLGFRTCLC